MLKYKVFTVGCKVAQAEGYQLRRVLERFGCQEAGQGDGPDLCVVNTCAVTATAVGKSRRLIAKLARLHPGSRIVVLGCYATVADPSIARISQVALVADHHRGILLALEQYLLQTFSGKADTPRCSATTKGVTTCISNIPLFDPQVKHKFSSGHQPRHRAFLKVQDGCDAACTYCLIPSLRPRVWSIPETEVLDQARALIEAGHQELVLTGIFLGAYGKDTARKRRFRQAGQPLAQLVEKILQIHNLGRLRLSSLEPLDLTPELLGVLAGSAKVAGHLHLPLQSGSDRVLRRMGRQYRSGRYLQAVEDARKLMPNLALTTDVIVGFPGETASDFQDTLRVCEQAGFAKIHIFPFSPRPGTVADHWKTECLRPAELQNREKILQNLEAELALRFRRRFSGQTVRVLVEKLENSAGTWYARGRADEYFEVRFQGDPNWDNTFQKVKVINATSEPVAAEPI